MLTRFAVTTLLLFAGQVSAQELRGKEASEFLAKASAAIKANCDQIKSWKGKIEAQHDKVHLSATFAIAANGDVLVHIDEMSGHKITVGGITRIVERGEPKPIQYEYFVHDDTVESVMFPNGPVPKGSGPPYRIQKQIPKSKFTESVHTKFLNPQQLMEDAGNRRFDRFFEVVSKSAVQPESTTVVTGPTEDDKTWTISTTYKSRRDAPESEPKLLSIWKLSESTRFLPVSHFQASGIENPSTTTYEYEQVKETFIPKKITFAKKGDRTQFDVVTRSINEGPDSIEASDRK